MYIHIYAKNKFLSRATAIVVIGPRQIGKPTNMYTYTYTHTYTYTYTNEIKKCINCHGEHSAAFKGCPVYVKTQEILKIRNFQNVSYMQMQPKNISLRTKI